MKPEYCNQDLHEDEALIDLRERVADYVAGDLDPKTMATLRQAIAADPALQAEERFWRAALADLPEAVRDPRLSGPGVGMATLIRERLSSATPANAPSRQLPLWSGWLVAAAAIAAAVIFVLPWAESQAPGSQIFDEYGAAIETPHHRHAAVRVIHRDAAVPAVNTEGTTLPHDHPEDRAWMGIWTKPIALEGFDRRRGLLLVRVADGSPAARVGLRPGDVLLAVDAMATATRWCIPAALEQVRPKQEITITFWRQGFEDIQQVTLAMGRCWE